MDRPQRWMIVLLSLIWGCPGALPVSPVDVVDAQARALRAGDLARASLLLASSARKRALHWPSVETIPAGRATEVERRAQWRVKQGQRVTLVRDAGGWRILGASAIKQLFVASSPRRALRIFAYGISHGHYDLVLSLMPRSERARWSRMGLQRVLRHRLVAPAWRRLAEQLRAGAFRIRWLEKGKRCVAMLMTPIKTQISLQRETDGWRVVDVRPIKTYSPSPKASQ